MLEVQSIWKYNVRGQTAHNVLCVPLIGVSSQSHHIVEYSWRWNVWRIYSYASHKDVSVNDGPQTQRWSHIIILYYNTGWGPL
jgi:hypothetical protein